MGVIRAIPKSLLPHKVTFFKEKLKDSDFWEEEVEKPKKIILEHVRIEPSSRIVRDKNNAEIQLVATLFYDCKNSSPRGIVFALDDVIVFNGMKHQIKTIEPLYDEKKLHHYEMGLIKRG